MVVSKKDGKGNKPIEIKPDSLWRKPITLDAFEDEDPLAALYRGREVGQTPATDEEQPAKVVAKTPKSGGKRLSNANSTKKVNKPAEKLIEKQTEAVKAESDESPAEAQTNIANKVTEDELKAILKIKSDFFRFTDLREILRGKSFDIYSYLRVLSGEQGFCKIKHLDLMSRLDISRPTLFKQQEWLTRLSLIEKRNVPGDHLGTFYTVHRIEEVLPLPESLMTQLESNIESLRQTDNR